MKKYTTAQRLRQIMRERVLKQVDILNLASPFCTKYNIKLQRNDLSQYVNGKVEPGQEKLTILGLALSVNEAWLMGYDVPMLRETKKSAPADDGRSKKIEKILNDIALLDDAGLDILSNILSNLVVALKPKSNGEE